MRVTGRHGYSNSWPRASQVRLRHCFEYSHAVRLHLTKHRLFVVYEDTRSCPRVGAALGSSDSVCKTSIIWRVGLALPVPTISGDVPCHRACSRLTVGISRAPGTAASASLSGHVLTMPLSLSILASSATELKLPQLLIAIALCWWYFSRKSDGHHLYSTASSLGCCTFGPTVLYPGRYDSQLPSLACTRKLRVGGLPFRGHRLHCTARVPRALACSVLPLQVAFSLPPIAARQLLSYYPGPCRSCVFRCPTIVRRHLEAGWRG